MDQISKMQIIEISVPDIGDFKDVPVIEILARPGEAVRVDDALVVLESDKATIDVPSPFAGVVKEVRVRLGDRVSQGSALILLEAGAAPEVVAAPDAVAPVAAQPRPMPVAAPAAVAQVPPPPSAPAGAQVPPPSAPAGAQVPPPSAPAVAQVPPPSAPAGALPHASPSIRRFARELGVDLHLLRGSAAKGRIQKSDILEFVKKAVAENAPPRGAGAGLDLLPWPQVDFAKFGPVERAALSKIKKISAANLTRNSIMVPHVTNFDEADVTALERFRTDMNKEREKTGEKLTMLAFMIKAAVEALKKYQNFNASLDGDELVLKRYFHIGFAADTPNGLVVPVIKDADKKGLTAIAAEAGELAAQARGGKIKPADMQGGCFTVSSLGGIGGNGFTPIINAPEVAILGAARAKMTPVWDGEKFQPRLIMPVSLSWDHRVIDGAEAARFLVFFTALLGDFRRVLL
jgi:pyruvate dehydrogenase E2 component (dihydrolipoamide acetyltransferase)